MRTKQQTIYICDRCEAEYNDVKQVECCERNHQLPIIYDCKFYPSAIYPTTITVTFPNKTVQTYKIQY